MYFACFLLSYDYGTNKNDSQPIMAEFKAFEEIIIASLPPMHLASKVKLLACLYQIICLLAK